MKCPFCNFADTKVIDSRAQDDNSVIRRRRVCEKCGKRFTTYERVDMIPITVIKRDGTREIFDKAKLQNGIMKSCNKRPVTAQMRCMKFIVRPCVITMFQIHWQAAVKEKWKANSWAIWLLNG